MASSIQALAVLRALDLHVSGLISYIIEEVYYNRIFWPDFTIMFPKTVTLTFKLSLKF